jgi:small subunit ribosomal protein S14
LAKKSWIIRQQREQRYSTRSYNRCERCGRARGYYRKFKLCRICLRELAHRGELPGVTKSSW